MVVAGLLLAAGCGRGERRFDEGGMVRPGSGGAMDMGRGSPPGVALLPGRRRDEIPPIDEPEFEGAGSSSLRDEDLLIGVVYRGEARAYPLWILRSREIVNDRFGTEPVCVTYCTLSASALAFRAKQGDRRLTFGNDGALYECNLVLYDRQSNTLWYQLGARAIYGPLGTNVLQTLPAALVRWKEWRNRHPGTRVLVGDRENGRFFRTWNEAEDRGDEERKPAAPVSRWDSRRGLIGVVVCFLLGDRRVCLPKGVLAQLEEGRVRCVELGLELEIGLGTGLLAAVASNGAPVTVVESYWFTWHAAFPESEVLTNASFVRAAAGLGR